MERFVNVKYINVKHNFCVVSSNLKLYFKSGNSIKIGYGDNSIVMSVISAAVSGLVYDTIGLSPILGKHLNIKENELVSIKEAGNLPIITSFSVTPLNKDDYEVLETFAMDIQSTMLEQVQVLNANQKLIIYVGNNINIAVIVGDIKPSAPGTIHFLTEVIVKTHKEITKKPRQNFLPRNKSIIPEKLIFRGLLFNKLPNFNEIPNNLPFHVYTSIPSLDCRFYSISLITNHNEDNKSILHVKLIYLNSKTRQDDVFMNNLIFDYFNCDPKSRFTFRLIENLPLVSNMDLIVNKNNKLTNSETLENFKSFLAENSDDKFILNSGIVFEFSTKSDFDNKTKCCLRFPKDTSTFCVVDNDFVRSVKYSIIDDNKLMNSATKNHKDKLENDENAEIYFENYFLDTKKLFNNWNELNSKPENILIVGKKGAGKTTISKHISRKLKDYPYFLFTEIVSCKNVKGKLQESLHTKLNNIFSQLIFHQPSCLVLDDVNVICENIVGDEMAPNAVYFNRISEMLNDFLHFITTTNEISVIATTESLNKLNKNLFSSRGNHLFKSIFHIGDLNKLQRKEMLKKMLNVHQLSDDINYDHLATRTEGFVMNDFHNFVNRALFESLKDSGINDNTQNTQISFDHCERALNSTPALSLLSVKFHTSGTKDFSNVGGLELVKKILIESLLWPVKYSSIFADAPLRLQSGILLYGPPGTGKTLLAAAAAKQCDLRLISIKGPELLSKYIGGSEQAVRDVFQKAQSAKPCILFFDEFDSLAPRRGHDNTGVTDRVVNQILTQLDGVESLTGVCVLAATSRPDLLDPALLRPGRLDRQLLCPLPNTATREKILKALASSKGTELPLEKDVDFKWLAENTKGYSGADLQAILYTAQLSLFDINDKESATDSNRRITQTYLQDALKKTRPSLTASERRKYEQIYSNFQKGEMIPDGSKKVTLA